MAVKPKPTIKATFETGDRPTQAEFADFIDSYVPIATDGAVGFMEVISTASSVERPAETLVAIATAVQGGKTGVIEVLATADVTALPAGVVGRELLSAIVTASAQGHLGGGAVGIEVFEAITTASAQGHLDIVSVVTATETAFGIVEIATQAEMEAATAIDRVATPANLPDYFLLETEQASTSGTSIDFTGIRASAKRITVMFAGVSTNGTSPVQIQLGDAGGFETSGYVGGVSEMSTGVTSANHSSGFRTRNTHAGTTVMHGTITLTLEDSSNNVWAASAALGLSNLAGSSIFGGTKPLSSTLTQVRITTINGTDTFDAGAINILVE